MTFIRHKEDTFTTVESLLDCLGRLSPLAVAFSGGVDSSLLAKAAVLAAEKFGAAPPVAIFAVSPTSSRDDIENARAVARKIGLELIELDSSGELGLPAFQANARDRCYHCKKYRFTAIQKLLAERERAGGPRRTLLDGENADDRALSRPGERAAAELGVRSPLAELGIAKAEVRRMARELGLPVADRPSAPCLATRFLYGLAPTAQLLRRVEAAETFLHARGFKVCRVRVDSPVTARIEVPAGEIGRFLTGGVREAVLEEFLGLGFAAVSLDLEGFVSGKMDRAATDK